MYYLRFYAFLIVCSLLPFPLSASAEVGEEGGLDTRVLIDISGSMKKNDPANLRRPALRLLVELLPEESRAGIWTFGQYVNMQVPLGTVDDAWKIRARKGAAEIHSRGLFTHIEEALRRSTADWENEDAVGRRHLILLTDGMVDVSKNPDESLASRERILNELLPRLQQYAVRVHTIALSQRADHQLMQTLSRETGGWYEQVDSADMLQRVFMRLFEKVGRPDAVPLVNNRFHLDESIDEATLLIFRTAGAPPIQLTDPSGQAFGAQDAPVNVSWHRDEGYELLTISAPQPGEWQVLADVDPDNRVLVVTDLKMLATELPGRLVLGERLPLFVHFSENGKQITDGSFLELINVKAVHKDAVGFGEPQPLFDDGQNQDEHAGDGRYTLETGGRLEPGLVELTLNAEGTTFKREQKQTFEVVPWFAMQVDTGTATGDAAVRVDLRIDHELLEPDTPRLGAVLVPDRGESRELTVFPSSTEGGWLVEVDPATLQGGWQLQLRLSATARSGTELDLALDPIPVQGRAEPPPPSVRKLEEPEPEPAPEVASESRWVEYAMIFGGINLVILVLAALAFWLMRRKGGEEFTLVDAEPT